MKEKKIQKEHASLRLRTYRAIRKVLLVFITVSIANLIFSSFFYTPKMYRILRRNEEMVFKYRLLQDRIRADERRLGDIRHRDNFVYRPLFGTDTLAVEGIYTPYPDMKYARLADDPYTPLMTDTWRRMDAFARQLYRTSLSLDELQILARNKENMSTAIPAIWPIDRTKLRNIGAFGWRIHPIRHARVFHDGVDLTSPTGTSVYASGDATVKSTELNPFANGYGKQILLDHQFGYQTRYAHLSEIFVRPGEKVARGQLIGRVGSTGASTGSHLHYEVIHAGVPVNAINYFDRGMTNEEYENMMEQMTEANLDVMEN